MIKNLTNFGKYHVNLKQSLVTAFLICVDHCTFSEDAEDLMDII